jgi:hypothetical protein
MKNYLREKLHPISTAVSRLHKILLLMLVCSSPFLVLHTKWGEIFLLSSCGVYRLGLCKFSSLVLHLILIDLKLFLSMCSLCYFKTTKNYLCCVRLCWCAHVILCYLCVKVMKCVYLCLFVALHSSHVILLVFPCSQSLCTPPVTRYRGGFEF